MSAEKVIEVARGELRVCEEPSGSNLTKYGFWYGVNGVPWCVIFLCWIFDQAGERMAFFGGGKTASCSTLLMWYQNMEQTVPVEQVQVGDIVILNFHGTRDTEHCGLAVEVERDKNGKLISVMTIEGNTTPGEEGTPTQQANGGCVALKRRFPYQIVAVCRPQYQPEPDITDDITGHWAQENWRWAEEIGVIHGYPDGSRKPDQNATRAEIITTLKRYDDYRFGGSGR